MQHTACMESARLLRAQADLERATKQYVYIGLSLHQTLSLLILHNRSTTVMELKHEFKVSDKHLWWIKVNALTSKKDWHALEALAKERKSPIGYVRSITSCLRVVLLHGLKSTAMHAIAPQYQPPSPRISTSK